MSTDAAIAQNVTTSNAHTRLHGRALLFSRALWFIPVAVALGLYALSVPLQAQALLTSCTDNCQFGQLTATEMQELQQLGLSLNFYIGYNIALSMIFLLVFVTVGAIIFWRKSDEWFGIYVAVTLVLFGIGFSNPLPLIGRYYPALNIPGRLLNGISGTLIGLFFYLFPDGRFVPRWTRWLIPLVVAREFAFVFSLESPLLLLFPIELGTFVFAQIYRYRRASNAVERQQTKWFVYGATVGILGFLSLILLVTFTSPNGQVTSVVGQLIGTAALYLFILLIPLSIMMAILHYRLWDIDILINRTLVYVPLTAILAGLYAGTITLSQRIFVALTGQQSDGATVLTTLVVVAAFTPIKDGLQARVDKRFKETRDPAKKLKEYGNQVDAVVHVLRVDESARRLLDEAMGAFDAASGAVFLQRGAEMRLVQRYGDSTEPDSLSVPLESDGKRLGLLTLGTRRSGLEYTAEEQAVLQQIAKSVTAAIALTERIDGERP